VKGLAMSSEKSLLAGLVDRLALLLLSAQAFSSDRKQNDQ
jgi:hypothetical protein